MELTPLLEHIRTDAVAALAGHDEDTRDQTLRLLSLLEPSFRLALLEAVSQAADEVTAQLPWGQAAVFLHGRDPEIRVEIPRAAGDTGDALVNPASPVDATAAVPGALAGDEDASATRTQGPDAAAEPSEDSGTARVTLRLPAVLKESAESRAADEGQSLNTWIVDAVRVHVQSPREQRRAERWLTGDQFTGWI